MTPSEVRDRLDQRFRLLVAAEQTVSRHRTLGDAMTWSYDLLNDTERTVLAHCAVFAGGFDLLAGAAVCDAVGVDEIALLIALDSLVHKSLVTCQTTGDRTRYGMLETVRAFATNQLEASGALTDTRDAHARFFTREASRRFAAWDGPGQMDELVWVDDEFSNLRAGFRWSLDRRNVVSAATIAAHATMLALPLQRYEAVRWAEEVLPRAVAGNVRQLQRLYTAAALCTFGRADDAVNYAKAALSLTGDTRYDPFDGAWSSIAEANAHRYAGRVGRMVEICRELFDGPGLTHVVGSAGLVVGLPATGRPREAFDIADEALAAARTYGNPFWIAYALYGRGRLDILSRTHRGRCACCERPISTPGSNDSRTGRRSSLVTWPVWKRQKATWTKPFHYSILPSTPSSWRAPMPQSPRHSGTWP
jgi:hypothetical protein